ncbi:GntR family transcriptional regulator [Peribacillus frigoritolerans]|uniref:GntR family transcriptional regulator n=1 Tax=Peribacillus frigoritolerans TaxID=450367 RepID=UPI0021CFCAA0|nr:GntR family transcriptional regulator [Peribacillus frigoritolerans]MCU6602211.1 GntR family transcriptional regulator [Peribacillus frigoritolerans]
MSKQTDYAYEYIKQRILDGTYYPSQKLNESDLSEIIKVSRNTLKKAFMKLEQENLVKIEKNKGATIKSFSLDEIMNYLEIREVIEGLVARKTAKNISDLHLETLEGILDKMQEHIQTNQFDEYSKCNKAFHDIIYNASENPQAIEMIKVIKTQLQRVHFKTILVPGRKEDSLKEHTQILEALKKRDEKEAEEAVKFHISQIRNTIKNNYVYLV